MRPVNHLTRLSRRFAPWISLCLVYLLGVFSAVPPRAEAAQKDRMNTPRLNP